MRGFLFGVLLAGTAAAVWFNPGNIMGTLGLKPLNGNPPATSASGSASNSAVVKWKDANGNIVFGDANTAPAGAKTEKLKLNAPNLVSMPKAPPPEAHANNDAAAPAAVEGVDMAPAPKPRNLALERMQDSLSGKQK